MQILVYGGFRLVMGVPPAHRVVMVTTGDPPWLKKPEIYIESIQVSNYNVYWRTDNHWIGYVYTYIIFMYIYIYVFYTSIIAIFLKYYHYYY